MNLDMIFFVSVIIIITTLVILILVVVRNSVKTERSKTQKEIEEYRKNYIEKNKNVGLTVMEANLLELKEYYIMTKIQYDRTFIITTIFSSIGCIIVFGGAIYGAINNDFETTKYTTLSGIVSEGVAALAFWMFTQAKEQLNLYSNELRENERILCAIDVVEKLKPDQKNEIIDKIISYILMEVKK